tara:strand:+ start:424 stop:567 length:144 start_codon:yes stop_codon:yes gene_type:complete
MDELEIKIEKAKKDYYKVKICKGDNIIFFTLERSEIRHLIGVLDNAI